MLNEIFKVNEQVEKEIEMHNPEPDWKFVFFGWMSEKLLKKHHSKKEKYVNKGLNFFLDGLKWEYGINCEINLVKAFEAYENGCLLNDSFSLFKMYIIHKKHFSKFNLVRNRDREIMLLYKAMAFSDSHYLFNFECIYNIEILQEVALITEYEDNELQQSLALFEKFSLNDNKYFTIDDVKFIQAIFLLKFHNNEEGKIIALSLLHYLADERSYLEASYKLASLFKREIRTLTNLKDTTLSYKYFEICLSNNYYKAYSDYALLLYQDNKIDKCKHLLEEGIKNGYPRNLFLYYDLTLMSLPDFDSQNSIKILKTLLKTLIRDLICGNFFSMFEFIYLYNMIKSHYDKSMTTKTNYIDEISQILEKLNINNIPPSFQELELEILLSLGYFNYIGIQGKRNFETSESLFKKAFKQAKSFSYKRFCYSYIFKIRRKRVHILKKELEDIFEKDEYEKKKAAFDNHSLKLMRTKFKLHKLYIDSFKPNKLNDYSSSYYYYMAKIYENGYGVEQCDPLASLFYECGGNLTPKNLGSGSIIAYHRKHKIQSIMKNGKFKSFDDEMTKLKDLDTVDKNCEICYQNEKSIIFFPCKHYVCCKVCADKILEEHTNCPICRTKILFAK